MARLNAFFAELIPTISRLRLARRLRVLTQTGSFSRLLSVVNQRVRDGPLSSCVRKEQGRYPSVTNQLRAPRPSGRNRSAERKGIENVYR